MTHNIEFWDNCYAAGRTGWDRGALHPALRKWLDADLLKPCNIIVPGCGRGFEVVELAQQGFDVTAIDIADTDTTTTHYQRCKRPSPAADIFEFTPPQPFDAVYEQTCLIDPDMRANYEETIFNWLKPAGELFVLFAQKAERPNQGPPFHCGLKEMKDIFPASRWSWPTSENLSRFEHPNGKLFELAHVLTKK